jgi:hypothetical protein
MFSVNNVKLHLDAISIDDLEIIYRVEDVVSGAKGASWV